MRNAVLERTTRLEKWDDKDQSYEGEFLGDSLHGQGTYRWNKTDVYEGGFFSNQKEGYAVLSFSNNSSFEGLFIKNRPFGPGILTHSNGRQDAGFWVGGNLVRLSRPVDYIVPRLAPTSAAKIKLLQFRRLITLNEKINSSESYILEKCGWSLTHQSLPYSNLIYDPRSIFFNHFAFDKTFFTKANNSFENPSESRLLNNSEDLLESKGLEPANKEAGERNSQSSPNPNCHCPEIFVMEYRDHEESYDVCSESEPSRNDELGLLGYYTKYGTFGEGRGKPETDFGEEEEGEDEEEGEETHSPLQIVSWNRGELCTEMLKQIFGHRTFEERLNFKIAKLMLGVRTEFRRTGERERECLLFLKMCSMGPARAVKDLLCRYELSEELMDSRGNTSLMFAAAADQHEILDLLLDYGVDVNAFNDEGLTPLNLCLLRRLAQAHEICNWERAFLPNEIQTVTENNFKSEMWKDEESIESLDRIFGDGMSADSKTGMSQMSEPEGGTNEVEEEGDTNTSDSGQQITMMKAKLIPKSIRRDEFEQSMRRSPHDRYLFDLSSQPQPIDVEKEKDASRATNTKIPTEVDNVEEEEEEGEYEKKEVDLTSVDKLRQIDKTIEILLRRGADPNISEVPKPSIHLGVFTKDVNVFSSLLRHGADPDCQMYPNEGLLTPLHVIALLKSAPETVEMCRILLNHGADSERETSPDFCICDSERGFLDTVRGRTPLQVLCMRPDLECADPKGYVTQIALMLAKYSDKKHFYKGHSSLTLTMLTGNIKLLTAFLESNYYDPNQSLGNDLGTALHVLVSTEFQKKTVYENSIKMCDLLLSAKADPLKEYKTPSKLIGTCVDYGYREIDEEKATRKAKGLDKKETKSSKQGKGGGVRDHLKDHIRVVEYLEEKASALKKASEPDESYTEKLGDGGGRDQTGKQTAKKEGDTTIVDENRNLGRQIEDRNDNTVKSKRGNEPNKSGQTGNRNKQNEHESSEQIGRQRRESQETRKPTKPRRESEKRGNPKNPNRDDELRDSEQTGNQRKETEKGGFSKIGKSEKPRHETEFNDLNREGNPGNPKTRREDSYNDPKGKGHKPSEFEGKRKSFERRKEKKRDARENQDGGRNFHSHLGGDPLKKGYTGKKARKTFHKMADDKDGQKRIKPKLRKQTDKCQKNSKSESSLDGRKHMLRVFKSFSLSQYPSCRERFPETLRQSMLQVFGNCVTIDVNELLLPYVVLRNGDLYYMFEGGRPHNTEQYSLI